MQWIMTLLFEGKNPIFLSFKLVFLKSHCQFLCLVPSSKCKRYPGHQVLCSTWCDCYKNLQYFPLPWLLREVLFHTHCFSQWGCNTEKNKLFIHWLCTHEERVFSLKVLHSNPLCSVNQRPWLPSPSWNSPILCPVNCLVLISKALPAHMLLGYYFQS